MGKIESWEGDEARRGFCGDCNHYKDGVCNLPILTFTLKLQPMSRCIVVNSVDKRTGKTIYAFQPKGLAGFRK